MARKYSVEIDAAAQVYTVHHQDCPHSFRSNLKSLDKVANIGRHHDDWSALQKARSDFPKPWGCAYCCCFAALPYEYARAG